MRLDKALKVFANSSSWHYKKKNTLFLLLCENGFYEMHLTFIYSIEEKEIIPSCTFVSIVPLLCNKVLRYLKITTSAS